MKKLTGFILAGSFVFTSPSLLASTTTVVPTVTPKPVVATPQGAATISLTGINTRFDIQSYWAIRNIVGNALTRGVVDKFVVNDYTNTTGTPFSFSACIEGSKALAPRQFNSLVSSLSRIKIRTKTASFQVTPVASCTPPTPTSTDAVVEQLTLNGENIDALVVNGKQFPFSDVLTWFEEFKTSSEFPSIQTKDYVETPWGYAGSSSLLTAFYNYLAKQDNHGWHIDPPEITPPPPPVLVQ